MTDLAEIAKRVYEANWTWQEGKRCLDCTEVVLRGGHSKTATADQNLLGSYLHHAGEISLRLLRPADGVVIGKMMKHLSDVGMLEAGSEIEDRLVKAFTVYLRGE